MGISFKISKKGTRYQPKPGASADNPENEDKLSDFDNLGGVGGSGSRPEAIGSKVANEATCVSISSTNFGGQQLPGLEEYEVSFTLNLFQKGYFIGKPTEMENLQPRLQDDKTLHPYDRASDTLFSAIQTGCLPGDILDDIPSKYLNGALVCEVRDYRKCSPQEGTGTVAADGPVVKKVRLCMSLENVVKDIPLLADDSWTYRDLMEVEAQIVKALQPQLYLDPTPRLDRIFADPCSDKINLGIGRKKLRRTPEVTVTSNSRTHGKKVYIDGAPGLDNYKPGDPGIALGYAAMQGMPENDTTQHESSGAPSTQPNNLVQEIARPTLPLQSQGKLQPSVNFPGIVHDRIAGSPANFSAGNGNIASSQTLMGGYNDTLSGNSSLLGKRENQDAHIAALSGPKRPKQSQPGDVIQHQQVGYSHDVNWRNQLLRSQLDANNTQYSSVGSQRYPHQLNNVSNQEAATSIYFNQQGMRDGLKEEQIETEKLDRQELERPKDALQSLTRENGLDQQQLRHQHLLQQPSGRNHLPPIIQWHNPRSVDKDARKDDVLQKRKALTSPRVSSGPLVQSPVSSKSGEISSGSVGQFTAAAPHPALGSQKATPNSNAVVGAPSTSSSPNESLHRQPHVSAAAKRKANSASKTPAMSGVGSPASVSNMNAPLNVSSPSIGTAPIGEQFDRFAKIDMVAQRYKLNLRKTKVDEYPAKKAVGCPSQHVAVLLDNSYNSDDFTDEMGPLSRSLVGGNINICKIRQIFFMCNEGNQVIKRRFSLAEKPFEGIVALSYDDADDSSFPLAWLLNLPTTSYADLLAAQFCALMQHEGHQKSDDQIRTLSSCLGSAAPGTQAVVPGIPSDEAAPEMKHSDVTPNVSAQPNNNIGMVGGSLNPSQSLSNNARMLASGGNGLASPVSQGYFQGAALSSRSQQLDHQPSLQQQQQILQHQMQHQQQQQQLPLPQIQRSSSMLSTNPLSQLMGQNLNMQMSNNNLMIGNKANAHLQLQQMLQQQQQQPQQQQQSSTQKRMIAGLNAAIGNMGGNNNMAGLGNIMGFGGLRPIAGLGNMRPNQMNLGTMSGFGAGMRPGSLSADQAAAMAEKLKHVHQSKIAGIYGQAAGIVGGSSMLPTSAGLPVLAHGLNRANMSQLPRNAVAPMGPPRNSGPTFYVNPQLQQQQLQQQQQQQQLLQQHQQQHQQQISSPLQQSQVGSPSIMMHQQQQQNQLPQQQISQQTAMSPQLSSGAIQQHNNNNNNNNNNNVCGNAPASPQLSSQTHGSVGSITSSPMEQLQGANKNGNA